jgi:hypothetical protein
MKSYSGPSRLFQMLHFLKLFFQSRWTMFPCVLYPLSLIFHVPWKILITYPLHSFFFHSKSQQKLTFTHK